MSKVGRLKNKSKGFFIWSLLFKKTSNNEFKYLPAKHKVVCYSPTTICLTWFTNKYSITKHWLRLNLCYYYYCCYCFRCWLCCWCGVVGVVGGSGAVGIVVVVAVGVVVGAVGVVVGGAVGVGVVGAVDGAVGGGGVVVGGGVVAVGGVVMTLLLGKEVYAPG
ncbi:hypothetical protein ACF0H5_009612 [Mactra antiquata]